MEAQTAAIFGIIAAVAIGALAVSRRAKTSEVVPAALSIHAVRIVRRDRTGLPEKQGVVRDARHVRALVEALGVDGDPAGECPPDYAAADFGIVLTGSDVYVRRNVYVFGLRDDASSASAVSVVSVTSAGCRVGPPADLDGLRRELRAAGTLD